MKRLKSVTENFGIKIISLLLGFIVWFNATTDDISIYSLTFKVKYTLPDLGDSLVIMSELPQNVKTSIKTSGKTYLRLRFSDRYIHKNIQNLRFGINEIKFSYEDIPVSLKDVEIFTINPQNVFINVDRKMRMKVPVKPGIVVVQDEALVVKNISVHPESVSITGPASVVGNIQYLSLEPAKVKKSTDTIVEAKLENSVNSLFELQPPQTSFTLKLVYDSLQLDSTYLRTGIPNQRVKVTYYKPYNLTASSRMFRLKTSPIDSSGEVKFFKVSVDASPPIRVKAIDPEIITTE